MWLDELNDLVVELSTKIDQHREILQKSESSTRYCLIDPLLTALGWDLSDPAQVLTEYNSGNGRANYAMAPGSGPPCLVVEAKSLFTPTAQGIAQSINYCLQDGIKYFVVTNGDDWEVYETHRPVPMQDKRVTAFKITDMNQSAVMGMLWLWRGNFDGGDPAMPAPPPPAEDVPITPLTPIEPPPATVGSPLQPRSEVTPPPTGIPLNELTNISGQQPPQSMMFPDGISKSAGIWNRLQIATVEWLVETGRLKVSMCPLSGPGGGVLVNTSPHRRTGTQFHNPRQIGNFWIEAHGKATSQVKRAKDMLNAAGVDPATVFVSSPAQGTAPLSQPYSNSPATSPPQRAVSKAAPVSAGVPLSELDPGRGQKPPQSLTFLDGVRKPLRFWYELQIAVVEWLAETGRLTEFNCPLKTDGGAHIVDTSPVKQNGRPFDQPRQIGNYWIDSFPNAVDQVRLTKTILQRCSVDPATVFVS